MKIMDSRERAMFGYLPNFLVQTLAMGDYIVGKYIIERKTWDDYYASIKDGRMLNMYKLFGSGYSPILLLEGDASHKEIVEEHMQKFILPNGIFVQRTNSIEESATFLSGLSEIWVDKITKLLPESWLAKPKYNGDLTYDKLYSVLKLDKGVKLSEFVKTSTRSQDMKILKFINGISEITAVQLLDKYSISQIIKKKSLNVNLIKPGTGKKYKLSQAKHDKIKNFIARADAAK